MRQAAGQRCRKAAALRRQRVGGQPRRQPDRAAAPRLHTSVGSALSAALTVPLVTELWPSFPSVHDRLQPLTWRWLGCASERW